MIKKKAGPLFMLLAIVAVFCIIDTSMAYETHNRPKPFMDYVPQERGQLDTRYDKLNEDHCRDCHGISAANRHHATDRVLILRACAQPDGCPDNSERLY